MNTLRARFKYMQETRAMPAIQQGQTGARFPISPSLVKPPQHNSQAE